MTICLSDVEKALSDIEVKVATYACALHGMRQLLPDDDDTGIGDIFTLTAHSLETVLQDIEYHLTQFRTETGAQSTTMSPQSPDSQSTLGGRNHDEITD